MEKKTVRIQLVMGASELEALDAWRFKAHIGSRSEAIRRCVADRIKTDPEPAKPAKR